MKIKKIIKQGEIVDVNQAGRELAIIKAGNGLRVMGFDVNGSKVLDTDISQGDNLSNLNCARLQFESEIDQIFIVWFSNFKYKFEKQADRVRAVRGYEVPLRHGVNLLMNEDPARINAKISADVDIYIGGDNMTSNSGLVTNGRLFKKEESFDLQIYGDVYYWVSDEAGRIFSGDKGRIKYAQQGAGRSALEQNGVDFFDIDVPNALDGVPFNLKAIINHKSKGVDGLGNWTNISVQPAFYITVGDQSSELLKKYDGYGSTGTHNGHEYENQTLDVSVTLSAGVHRVFIVESMLDNDAVTEVGHDWYSLSFSSVRKIYSDDPLLAVKGYAQVLEERA
ncbi:hypothetical protein [Pseudoalteromonas sp. MelDa3]|uniref:hypothetical protein n=1 Tax=Pseudoalteromonas sp. MelDa3 TaxID=888435 RepID=UPI000CB1A732|nr:hypothetical protein [Pseudoalteromonas sp. MelDa3]PLT23512.1 hypothetical protein CXF89_19240 [Pseudoalteromonas sp. MelDa3]